VPVLKHAKKKLRQDVRRTRENKRVKSTYKDLLKKARTDGSEKAVSEAFSAIDKAAKNHVIHKNKAARLKAALTKTASGEVKSTTPSKKPTKKASAKKATKKKS
jgi:small subunit ribosomal protein S20